jgi:hypothetical protein
MCVCVCDSSSLPHYNDKKRSKEIAFLTDIPALFPHAESAGNLGNLKSARIPHNNPSSLLLFLIDSQPLSSSAENDEQLFVTVCRRPARNFLIIRCGIQYKTVARDGKEKPKKQKDEHGMRLNE